MKKRTWLKRRMNNKQKGFTLIELLIVIALMAIISIPISASLIFGVNVFKSETEISRHFTDQQAAFENIKSTLRNEPYQVRIVDDSGTEQLNIGEDPDTARIFFLSGEQLMLQIGANSAILCDHVTAFNLTDVELDETGLVTQLTVTLTTTVINREHTLTSSIALRRY